MPEPDIYPWNRPQWEALSKARERSHHAWLFVGPPGVGKLHTALAVAQHHLGRDARGAHLFSAVSHPDFHVLMPEIRMEGDGLLQRYAQRYPDPERRKKPKQKPKKVITVGQVRTLVERIVTRSYMGTDKIVFITPAEEMNVNAANALLKILEEPAGDTLFLLVTSRPGRLLPTIRSRTTWMPFRPPSRDLARSWLESRLDAGADATLMLQLAGGAPLAALELAATDEPAVRRTIATDITSMWERNADPVAIATRWAEIGAPLVLRWLQRIVFDLIRGRFSSSDQVFCNIDLAGMLRRWSDSINLDRAYALTDHLSFLMTDQSSPLDTHLLLQDVAISVHSLPAR